MNNNYIPRVVKIERVLLETPDIKTISLRCKLDYTAGQFLEVSAFGAGESPISISSSPEEEFLKVTFKRVGRVTSNLFNLKEGDSLGIRGPFGNGFPLEELKGKEILFVGGGIGFAPLRSLVKSILDARRSEFADLTILYGAKKSQELLFRDELDGWSKEKGLKVLLTVDNPDGNWRGRVGVVTKLLDEIKIDPDKSKAIVCGPVVMMRFTTAKLIEMGMKPSNIILSLERYMKCGLGKCGHCYISDKFVCRDGPVFTLEELDNMIPAEILQ